MKPDLSKTFSKTNHSDIKYKMLDNIEFFHYAEKFNNQTFILCFKNLNQISDLVFDFYLLKQTKINIALVCSESEAKLLKESENGNRIGYKFCFFDQISSWRFEENNREYLPVFIAKSSENSDVSISCFAGKVASGFSARKIFFMNFTEEKTLTGNGEPIFESNLKELEEREKNQVRFNISQELLNFFRSMLSETPIDCILLKQEEGSLYREVFSHFGYGTILSKDYSKVIRKGEPADILPILFMTKVYEKANVILPMNRDTLLRKISDSFVYTVDENIVAFAMLIEYGSAAELAKFCTQPRYQGKGKAKELALKLIDEARSRGYSLVFSLTILEPMGEFFKNLGFREIDRNQLPDKWKQNYDMSRPSKAFIMNL